jgi:hypothetical protein
MFVAIEIKEKVRMCDVDEDDEAEDEAEVYLPGGISCLMRIPVLHLEVPVNRFLPSLGCEVR